MNLKNAPRLLVLLALGLAFAFTRPTGAAETPTEPAETSQTAASASPKAHETPDEVIAEYTIWLAVFTAVLACATVVLAAYTGRLYYATAGLQDLALKQDELTRTLQRAYISVEPDGIRPHRRRDTGTPAGNPEDLTGHFIIRNVGNLPAREVSWNSGIICNANRYWVPKPPGHLVGRLVVTPGTRMRRASGAISNTEFRLFDGAAERYCYVWGRVTYIDGLGALRTTDFCHRYNCEALRDGNEIPERFARYHEHGNDGT